MAGPTINLMSAFKAVGMLEADAVQIRQRGCSRVVAQQHQGARALSERVGILQPTLMRAAREGQKPRVPPKLASRVFGHALRMFRKALPATFVGVSSGVTSRDGKLRPC